MRFTSETGRLYGATRSERKAQAARRNGGRGGRPLNRRHGRGYMATAKTVEWATPPDLYREYDAKFHFTVDVCATPENAKTPRFFTREQDGLAQTWAPEVCWMNPPYGRELARWVEKAQREAQAGAVVVALLPARTDTGWWHDHVMGAAEVRFLRGRLTFGGAKTSAPFPSAVVVWRPEPLRLSNWQPEVVRG